MSIVNGYPPNIAAIRNAFPITDTTIFSYAPHIYVPSGRSLPLHLVQHEKTHHRQQAEFGGAADWWDAYILDPAFRLQQEIEAYSVQWRASTNLKASDRRVLLRHICGDLSGALYGRLVSFEEAMKLITGAGV